jgi:hypothetical protein
MKGVKLSFQVKSSLKRSARKTLYQTRNRGWVTSFVLADRKIEGVKLASIGFQGSVTNAYTTTACVI